MVERKLRPAPSTLHLLPSRKPARTGPSPTTKLFVLDTNVLMHDPTSLFRFEEHDIYLPILTLEEEITPVERVRTRRRAFERLVALAGELKSSGNDGWVVQHIQDPENAQRLVERCREVMGSDPIFVSEIGPVIGAHTGPGLLGVGGLPAELLR